MGGECEENSAGGKERGRVLGAVTRTQLLEGFQESGGEVERSPGEKERVQ